MHYNRWAKNGDPGPAKAIYDIESRIAETCSIAGCTKPIKSRDLCSMHYQRWQNDGDTGSAESLYADATRLCQVADCNNTVFCRDLCHFHYSRTYTLSAKYNMPPEELNAMHERQGGLCAICNQPQTTKNKDRLFVDHDHETGAVRELLCHQCNAGIGHFKDDPVILEAAIAYILKHRRHLKSV